MKMIIIGCGRMGSGLAMHLNKKGHQVTVIDSNAEAFKLLDSSFHGEKIEGIGFDREVLERAKIESVDALVSFTASDEVNALTARIAKNIYRVPKVIARLYDPRKADIYRHFGIQVISTTEWGIERSSEILSYNQIDSVYEIGTGRVHLVRIEVPVLLVGHTVNELAVIGEIQVVAITRENNTFIPTAGSMFESQDILYVSVIQSATDKFKSMLGIA